MFEADAGEPEELVGGVEEAGFGEGRAGFDVQAGARVDGGEEKPEWDARGVALELRKC